MLSATELLSVILLQFRWDQVPSWAHVAGTCRRVAGSTAVRDMASSADLAEYAVRTSKTAHRMNRAERPWSNVAEEGHRLEVLAWELLAEHS